MGEDCSMPLLRGGDQPVWKITSLDYQEIPFVLPRSEWRGSFRYRRIKEYEGQTLWLYGDIVIGFAEVFIDGHLSWRSRDELGSLCVRLPRDTLEHIIEIRLTGKGVIGLLGYFGIVHPVGKWIEKDSLQKKRQKAISGIYSSCFTALNKGGHVRIDGRGNVWSIWSKEDRLIGLLLIFLFINLWGYSIEFGIVDFVGHSLVMVLYGILGYYIAVGLKWKYDIELRNEMMIGFWGMIVYIVRLVVSFLILGGERVRGWLWRWGWRKDLIYLIPFGYVIYTFIYNYLLSWEWLIKLIGLSYGIKVISIYGDWGNKGGEERFRYVLYLCILELGISVLFYEL